MAESLGAMTRIHGLAHITGGGLIENPPRAFGDDLALHLDLASYDLPPVFSWLKKRDPSKALRWHASLIAVLVSWSMSMLPMLMLS